MSQWKSKKQKYREPKKSLPLVGTNYKWFDDDRNIGGTDMKDTVPLSDDEPRISGGKLFMNKNIQYKWYTDPTFSKGNHTYNYKKIKPENIYSRVEKREKLKRASYIPYIINKNNDNYWLLGSFHDFPDIKTDFGGACEYYESPNDCATRELKEETQNVLMEPIKNAIIEGKVTVFKGYNKNPRSNDVVIFIMVNIDGNFEMLDDIQATINTKFREKFAKKKPGLDDLFGPLGFYKEYNMFHFRDNNGVPLHTAFNFTDFIKFYRNLGL